MVSFNLCDPTVVKRFYLTFIIFLLKYKFSIQELFNYRYLQIFIPSFVFIVQNQLVILNSYNWWFLNDCNFIYKWKMFYVWTYKMESVQLMSSAISKIISNYLSKATSSYFLIDIKIIQTKIEYKQNMFFFHVNT